MTVGPTQSEDVAASPSGELAGSCRQDNLGLFLSWGLLRCLLALHWFALVVLVASLKTSAAASRSSSSATSALAALSAFFLNLLKAVVLVFFFFLVAEIKVSRFMVLVSWDMRLLRFFGCTGFAFNLARRLCLMNDNLLGYLLLELRKVLVSLSVCLVLLREETLEVELGAFFRSFRFSLCLAFLLLK